MRNMGNAAEYLMFFKWKSNICGLFMYFLQKFLGQK